MAARLDRAAALAFNAFMSMDRAVAIVGPAGELLQPNLVFQKLFGNTDLIDRIRHDACTNNGKSDSKITLSPDLPRFRGEVSVWDQGSGFGGNVSSFSCFLGPSFGSAESIFSSRPART